MNIYTFKKLFIGVLPACVPVGVIDLDLELKTVVNCRVGAGN